MKLVSFLAIIIFAACSNAPADQTASETPSVPATNSGTAADRPETPAPKLSPAIASLDMGEYLISVHEISAYHPDDMQSKMMKWNDAEKDYYIIDCSVQNKTDHTIDTGKDMLSVYFTFSDGTVSTNILRGATILASSQVGKKIKYPQAAYDQIWGQKFPAGAIKQAELFGVEAPEGVTITGFGFFKKNPAKNKEVKF